MISVLLLLTVASLQLSAATFILPQKPTIFAMSAVQLDSRQECNLTAPLLNGQQYFGPAAAFAAVVQSATPSLCVDMFANTTVDDFTLDGEYPFLANAIYTSGRSFSGGLLYNSNDSLRTYFLKQVTRSDSDITASLEGGAGWTTILPLRIATSRSGNSTGVGIVVAITDDWTTGNTTFGVVSALEAAIRSERFDVNRAVMSLSTVEMNSIYVAVIVDRIKETIFVVSGAFTTRVLTFHAPLLFDGNWHLLAMVFEPTAASRYFTVSLNVDGKNPSVSNLQQCSRRTDAMAALPRTLSSTALAASQFDVTSQPSNGVLSFGSFDGSLHSIIFYNEVLPIHSIAALGTTGTKIAAAGMDRDGLFAIGFTFVAVAVFLFVWSVTHARHEISHDNMMHVVGIENDVANEAKMLRTAVATGGAQVASGAKAAAAAIADMRSTAAPAAKQSISMLIAISSIGLEVPQGLSVLLSSMSFPATFKKVFGNVFDMMSIRFDLPEVDVPPYAPLLVVLVVVAAAVALLLVVYGIDRVRFRVARQKWRMEREAYRLLVQGVVERSFAIVHANETTKSTVLLEHRHLIRRITDSVTAQYPHPPDKELLKGVLGNEDDLLFDHLVSSFRHFVLDIPIGTVECIVRLFAVESEIIMSVDQERWTAQELRDLNVSYYRDFDDRMKQELHKALSQQTMWATGANIVTSVEKRVKVGEEGANRECTETITELTKLSATEVEQVFAVLVDVCVQSGDESNIPFDVANIVLQRTGIKVPAGSELRGFCVSYMRQLTITVHQSIVAIFQTVVPLKRDNAPMKFEKIFLKLESRIRESMKHSKELSAGRRKRALFDLTLRGRHDDLEAEEQVKEVVEGELRDADDDKLLEYDERSAAGLEDFIEFATEAFGRVADGDEGTLAAAARKTPVLTRTDECNLESCSDDEEGRSTKAPTPQPTSGAECPPVSEISFSEIVAFRKAISSFGDADGPKLQPPHNGRAPTRLYHLFDQTAPNDSKEASDAGPEKTLRICNQWYLKSLFNEHTGQSRALPKITPTVISRRCPQHTDCTLMPATATHYQTRTMHGGKMYRCCNSDCDEVKQMLHGTLHTPGDPCDEGELLVCSQRNCAFCLCKQCFKRESGALDALAVNISGIDFAIRYMDPNIVQIVGLVALEAMLFPITQIPVLVMSCNPQLVCWLSHCYTDQWNSTFRAAFALSIILLIFRVLIAAGLFYEMRRRQSACRAMFDGALKWSVVAEDDRETKRNTMWQRFLLNCDRSLLRSMYMGVELDYISMDPVMKLALDVGIVCAAALSPTDSTTQKCAIGAVYAVYGIVLGYTNPKLQLSLDILSKAVAIHQLLVVGFASIHSGVIIGMPTTVSLSASSSVQSTLVMAVMLLATSGFVLFVCVTMWIEVVSPFLRQRKHNKVEMLLRREAQMVESFSRNKQHRLNILNDVLKEKRTIFGDYHCQVALTVALKSAEDSDVLPESTKAEIEMFVVGWLEKELAREHPFDDVTPTSRDFSVNRYFSFDGRQLRSYEVKALAEALLRVQQGRTLPCKPSLPSDVPCHAKELLRLGAAAHANALERKRRFLIELTDAAADELKQQSVEANSLDGMATPCNHRGRLLERLQLCSKSLRRPSRHAASNLLSVLCVAGAADNLTMDALSFGCVLPIGSHITNSTFLGADLSRSLLPRTSFFGCALDREVVVSRGSDTAFREAFSGTARHLPIIGHQSGVMGLSFSPDGLLIASSGQDKTVRLWDASSGVPLLELAGHTGSITNTAFSPMGRILASGSDDKTVRLWDYQKGENIFTLTGHTFGIARVAFNANGLLLVSCGWDKTARIWNVDTGAEEHVLQHDLAVICAYFSPDGRSIATSCAAGKVFVWDINPVSGGPAVIVATVVGHARNVLGVAYSPDGSILASCSFDNTICLWDVKKDYLHIRTIAGHADGVTGLAFSPDGTKIATGSRDKSVRLWDAATGDELRMLSKGAGGSAQKLVYSVAAQSFVFSLNGVQGIAFSSDGTRIASAESNGTVMVWEALSGSDVRVSTGSTGGARAVACSPVDSIVAIAFMDGTVRVFDVWTGLQMGSFGRHLGGALAVTFSPDGRRVVSGGHDNVVRVWDLDDLGSKDRNNDGMALSGHSQLVSSVVFSPDGSLIASSSYDKTIRVWNAHSGSLEKEFNNPPDDITCVTFSRTNAHIACSTMGPNVSLFSLADDTVMRFAHTSCLTASFSPDGLLVASAGWDKTVKFWHTHTGEQSHVFSGHSDCIMSVTFATHMKAGTLLAACCRDGSLFLWSLQTQSLLFSVAAHEMCATGVHFMKGGTQVATCSFDKTVRIWDSLNGALVRAISPGAQSSFGSVRITAIATQDGEVLTGSSPGCTVSVWDESGGQLRVECHGHRAPVACVAFCGQRQQSTVAARYASGSFDMTVRLWDAAGTTVHVLGGHTAAISCLAATPSGRHILSGSVDATMRVWDSTTGATTAIVDSHSRPVTCVACAPVAGNEDAEVVVATGSWDTTVRLMHLTHDGWCTPFRKLEGHTAPLTALQFGFDGGRCWLVSCSLDMTGSLNSNGTCILWSANDGEEIARVEGQSIEALRDDGFFNCFLV